MSAPHNDIIIYFMRHKDISRRSTDDVLTIKKMSENHVKAIYKEWNNGGKPVIDIQIINYQQLFAYLWRVFWMVGIDEDPFVDVQFIVPGYPNIIVSVNKLHANLTPIMELLMSTCWSWPTKGRLITPGEQQPTAS